MNLLLFSNFIGRSVYHRLLCGGGAFLEPYGHLTRLVEYDCHEEGFHEVVHLNRKGTVACMTSNEPAFLERQFCDRSHVVEGFLSVLAVEQVSL